MPTAIFTGAGASKAMGYPLTFELLPLILRGIEDGTLFEDAAEHAGTTRAQRARRREDLLRDLHLLVPGLGRVARRHSPLITDLFSLLDHAIQFGEHLPIGGDRQIRRCRWLLSAAMADVLLDVTEAAWQPLRERRDTRTRRSATARIADRFAAWVRSFGANGGVVTTNYDIGLDQLLYRRESKETLPHALDLGFDWRHPAGTIHPRPIAPRLRVYKLHGSLDTLKCHTCGFVYFNWWGPIAHQAQRERLDRNNTCECRSDERLDLHLVSPSFIRDVRDASLLATWKSALEWLRRADRWILVGYSLPTEDIAIRSLLLRAFHTADVTPSVTVVQQGRAAEPRYRQLFPRVRFHDAGLGKYLDAIGA